MDPINNAAAPTDLDRRDGSASPTKRCQRCGGVGKVQWPEARCNCGSGEGCDIHDDVAIGLWGKKCPDCNGTGRIATK